MATIFVVSYNFLHEAFRSTPFPLSPPSSSSSSSYALPSSSSTMLVASSAFERRLVIGLGQKTTTTARQLRSCCYNSRWVNLLSSRGMCNGVLASAGGPSPTHSSSGAEKSKAGDSVLLPEDIRYLLKLSAACIFGAIVIKYGSIIVPELTRPDYFNALVCVFLPVLTSMVALILASIKEARP